MPNVGLEDESPSSKSEDTPEDDKGCVGDADTAATGSETVESPPPPIDATDSQPNPRHQTFTSGERRRRKLPEIPKNKKCK